MGCVVCGLLELGQVQGLEVVNCLLKTFPQHNLGQVADGWHLRVSGVLRVIPGLVVMPSRVSRVQT